MPRRWWPGPLDVERLAWEAVTRARDAAAQVAAARGLEVTLDTTPELVAASFAAIEHLRIDGREPRARAPLSGFFAAHDGWIRLHGNYPHHAAALRVVLGAGERPDVAREVARRDALDLEAEIRGAGGIAAAVRSTRDWARHPHALATAAQPWVAIEQRGKRPALAPLRSGSAPQPLAGVRVLDLTRVIAGPTCSQLLACLGADVLRIDPPHRPEILDQHLSAGMGKRSAVVDLRSDLQTLRDLAESADVILCGYRPGALAEQGLGIEQLEELSPGAVIVSLSAWGETGPWGRSAGFDSIVQAASGIAAACGSAERPGALPVQALDHASGHRMAAAVMEELAAARAGTIRVHLLGAARTLLGFDPPPPPERGERTVLPVPRVVVETETRTLEAVPPPLRIDGADCGRAVGAYGGSGPHWLS